MLFLLLIILAGSAHAWDDIAILDLRYESGKLFLKDTLYLRGFYPDRNVQPSQGYKLSVLDGEKEVYSFRFEIPNADVDISNPDTKELSGGQVRLKRVDFSLTVPFPENADRIEIYDDFNKKIIEAKPESNSTMIVLISAAALVIIVLLAVIIRKIRPRPA